jgi:hypothetical protein
LQEEYNILLLLVQYVCLYICSLFNDTFSETQTTAHLMKGRQVNDELEFGWKQLWSNFKEPSQHSPGGSEEKPRKTSQDNRTPYLPNTKQAC